MMPRPVIAALALSAAGELLLAGLAWHRHRAGTLVAAAARAGGVWLGVRWLTATLEAE